MSKMGEKRVHFVRQLIENDLKEKKHTHIVTRFPPEPNGYLHIGHAKSICLNFGLATEFNGQCFLRFDDTNPMKEEEEYVQSIIKDVHWLGFEWDDLTYSSDYYEQLYQFAMLLIEKGKAYVDSLSMEEIRAYRGTLQEPGKESPYRTRSIEDNMMLFQDMRRGVFPDGSHVLRAKIDMSSPNLNMRDPVLYRIRHAHHQRTGDAWCIYPMYDYAHPISDALEKVTHSLCTLEFQDHRPLYDWFIEQLPLDAKPIQTEFSRLNLSHTVTSKRKLRELVEKKYVDGWDDPRLPTLSGMRKRGYPPEAIRIFCDQIGLSRSDSVIDMSLLENCVRDVLNKTAKRSLAVLSPIKVVILNYPDTKEEILQAPLDAAGDFRSLPFSKELWIERDDFKEIPEKGYFRLAKGTEVRLRHAYIIRCVDVLYDEAGNVSTLHCTYDEATLGKNPLDRKVKGVIHWVSCKTAHPTTVYQYDRLFMDENPGAQEVLDVNPNSLRILQGYTEPYLEKQPLGEVFQFERLGYYAVHTVKDGSATAYHRVVDLRDTWNNR